MNKSLRYTLYVTGGIFLLFIIYWVVILVLLSFNKELLDEKIISHLSKRIDGDIKIGGVDAVIVRTFPNISIRLRDVSIRDSLYDQHHHDIFQAASIYVKLEPLKLLLGKRTPGRVIIENGYLYSYVDACDYHSIHISPRDGPKRNHREIPSLTLNHMRLISENEIVNSYHDIDIEHLNCDFTRTPEGISMSVRMNSFVNSLGFNMARGSYLHGKDLEGKFKLFFDNEKILHIDRIKLNVDGQAFTVDGYFNFQGDPNLYDLKIQTKKIPYEKAIGLLTQSLQPKFDSIKILQPISPEAHISGTMERKVIPRITVQFSVKNSDLVTPLGPLNQGNFSFIFRNLADTLCSAGDENSSFLFTNISASKSRILMTSSKFEINNLVAPVIAFDLHSTFDLANLNELNSNSSVKFNGGKAQVDINYFGPFAKHVSTLSTLNGTISFTETDLVYGPENLTFKDCKGELVFVNQDLFFKNMSTSLGNTDLAINGSILSLLKLLKDHPEQLEFIWNVTTPDLNLNDFISLIGDKSKGNEKKEVNRDKVSKTTENIDRMLREGTYTVNLEAKKMHYKKFVSSDLTGSIRLIENNINLNNISLSHAGGKIILDASLANSDHANTVNFKANLNTVAIPELFYAFDDFGQDAITSKNMKGILTASIEMSGSISDKAQVVEKSMKGAIDFSIRKGELINFEPVMNISATAFKNRDFSHLVFAELNNRLEIDGSAITIHKMEITSNVVTLFVEGIYDSKNGTDMSIQVPISSLAVSEQSLQKKGRAGLNVRLRAKTGDDGKLKVTWDPFNTAQKQRDADAKVDMK